jgi:hypothetical protein
MKLYLYSGRAEWPRGLTRGSAGSYPAGGMDGLSLVSVVCCQVEVSDGPITRPEESYRLWCFSV